MGQCLLLASAPTWGFGYVPTQKEFYVLPEYCKASFSRLLRNRERHGLQLMPPTEVARWQTMIGPDFEHLHHFCLGLTHLSKALDPSTSRSERAGLFRQAEAAIATTQQESRPGYPLWVEMSLKRARALDGLGKRDAADGIYRELLESSAANPDVWTELAQSLKRRGEINDAIALLEQGLAVSSKKGPLLFWLANYYYDLGDFEKARATAERAEAAGMKVDRLKRRLDRTQR